MAALDDIKKILAEAHTAIDAASSRKELDQISIRYLGRKGPLTAILKSLKDLPIDQRKTVGAAANNGRRELEEAVKNVSDRFQTPRKKSSVDPTLPGIERHVGAVHIITQTIADMCRSFYGMGFSVAYGPEVESDHYNFEALNFPPDHPARDMQDTFYIESDRIVLRTHTTPVQPRVLEKTEPPVKVIMPGRCYRNEEISARSHCVFHQVDGFMVDEGVTLADLKATLVAFCHDFFGREAKLRFRPSYFPFTEPSAEVDISCFLCGGKGCRVCKHTGWLEILGSGMIDPNVLDACGLDSEKYTGYAFGIGVERPAMLKYGINDIRLFYENDIRFLRQFG